MKVNLPINMSQTGPDVSARSTGQTEPDAISPFSIQMNKILHQNDEKDGNLEENTNHAFHHMESDEEDSGSMSKSNVSRERSDISDRDARDREVNNKSKADSVERRAASREDPSWTNGCTKTEKAENASGEKTGNNGNMTVVTSGLRDVGMRTGAETEKNTAHLKQGVENQGTKLRKVSAEAVSDSVRQESRFPEVSSNVILKGQVKTDSNSAPDNIGDSLPASAGESCRKDEIRRFHARHHNMESDGSISEKVLNTEADHVPDSFKHQGAARKTNIPRLSDFSGNETSAKTNDGNAASSGEDGESGNNSNQIAAARTFPGNGSVSQATAGGDANSTKGWRSETTVHISASSTPAPGSNAPMGMSTVKPVAPHSNEFFSQITERIQFLIRDGRDAVRIRLQPDEFGHMEIRAESTARGITVRISAETGNVKSILENNLHILHQNLQELGLKVDRIQVELQSLLDPQNASGYSSRSGHSNSGQNEKGMHRNYDPHENSTEDTIPEDIDAGFFVPDSRFHTIA